MRDYDAPCFLIRVTKMILDESYDWIRSPLSKGLVIAGFEVDQIQEACPKRKMKLNDINDMCWICSRTGCGADYKHTKHICDMQVVKIDLEQKRCLDGCL